MCGLWNVDLHPKANLPAKFERNLRDRLAHMFWFSQTCSLKQHEASLGPIGVDEENDTEDDTEDELGVGT